MSFYSPQIVVTNDGVYQPPIPLKFDIALFAGLLLLAAGLIFLARLPWFFGFYILLALGSLVRTWLEYRRYGPLGRPKIAGVDETLVIALLDAGEFKIAISEIRKLVVYGLTERRIYRFVKIDGSYVEATPQWKREVENCAIDFLHRLLPGRVVVEEPQTTFASVRGDGPYDEG